MLTGGSRPLILDPDRRQRASDRPTRYHARGEAKPQDPKATRDSRVAGWTGDRTYSRSGACWSKEARRDRPRPLHDDACRTGLR